MQVGESTTDLAWDGHAIVCENGTYLAESDRFQQGSQFILADLDLDRLKQERMRQTSFSQNIQYYQDSIRQFRDIKFDIHFPVAERQPAGGAGRGCPIVRCPVQTVAD